MRSIKSITVNDIKDFYDLPIDASMNTSFWTDVTDEFLLAFGRMMEKHDLGLESFDLFLNLYKSNRTRNIDLFIETYLTTHKNEFTRANTNELVPIQKNGLYYSKHWGEYC
jgi:hypothetical protein